MRVGRMVVRRTRRARCSTHASVRTMGVRLAAWDVSLPSLLNKFVYLLPNGGLGEANASGFGRCVAVRETTGALASHTSSLTVVFVTFFPQRIARDRARVEAIQFTRHLRTKAYFTTQQTIFGRRGRTDVVQTVFTSVITIGHDMGP